MRSLFGLVICATAALVSLSISLSFLRSSDYVDLASQSEQLDQIRGANAISLDYDLGGINKGNEEDGEKKRDITPTKAEGTHFLWTLDLDVLAPNNINGNIWTKKSWTMQAAPHLAAIENALVLFSPLEVCPPDLSACLFAVVPHTSFGIAVVVRPLSNLPAAIHS